CPWPEPLATELSAAVDSWHLPDLYCVVLDHEELLTVEHLARLAEWREATPDPEARDRLEVVTGLLLRAGEVGVNRAFMEFGVELEKEAYGQLSSYLAAATPAEMGQWLEDYPYLLEDTIYWLIALLEQAAAESGQPPEVCEHFGRAAQLALRSHDLGVLRAVRELTEWEMLRDRHPDLLQRSSIARPRPVEGYSEAAFAERIALANELVAASAPIFAGLMLQAVAQLCFDHPAKVPAESLRRAQVAAQAAQQILTRELSPFEYGRLLSLRASAARQLALDDGDEIGSLTEAAGLAAQAVELLSDVGHVQELALAQYEHATSLYVRGLLTESAADLKLALWHIEALRDLLAEYPDAPLGPMVRQACEDIRRDQRVGERAEFETSLLEMPLEGSPN
ncbi:MAG: hypothetical protein ABI743_07080, partial [bacterium]